MNSRDGAISGSYKSECSYGDVMSCNVYATSAITRLVEHNRRATNGGRQVFYLPYRFPMSPQRGTGQGHACFS